MPKYIQHLSSSFRLKILTVPWRIIVLLFIVGLFFVPVITTNPYIMRILNFACIFAILAASWDFLAGYMGQLNLGQAAFFGTGAYISALMNIHLKVPPWITIPTGSVAAVFIGIIVCLPALRLRGFYLALVTMAFPIILVSLIYFFPEITGGELGIYGVQSISSNPIITYYILVIIMFVSLFMMWKLTDSKSRVVRTGVIMAAIREDEIAARASGIRTNYYKIFAFIVSGFFGGLSGAFFAHTIRVAGPSTLDVMQSFNPILWTVFGGIATFYGPVAGVFILYPLSEFLKLFAIGDQLRLVVQSILLIIILLFMPQGITTWVRDHIEKTCLRCKAINFVHRRHCRVCRAVFHKGEEQEENILI